MKTSFQYTKWLEILETLAEMNRRKIPVTLVNPFDYMNFLSVHTSKEHVPMIISRTRKGIEKKQAANNPNEHSNAEEQKVIQIEKEAHQSPRRLI